MKSFIVCGMALLCIPVLGMEEKETITEYHFDTIRIYPERNKPWTQLFYDLKRDTKDEFALQLLNELKESFFNEDYCLTDENSIITLTQPGKSLISKETNKITKEVYRALKASMEDELQRK